MNLFILILILIFAAILKREKSTNAEAKKEPGYPDLGVLFRGNNPAGTYLADQNEVPPYESVNTPAPSDSSTLPVPDSTASGDLTDFMLQPEYAYGQATGKKIWYYKTDMGMDRVPENEGMGAQITYTDGNGQKQTVIAVPFATEMRGRELWVWYTNYAYDTVIGPYQLNGQPIASSPARDYQKGPTEENWGLPRKSILSGGRYWRPVFEADLQTLVNGDTKRFCRAYFDKYGMQYNQLCAVIS